MKKYILTLFLIIGVAFGGMAQQLPSYQMTKGEPVILRAHSTNALTYLWFKDGVSIDGEYKERLTTEEEGFYTVIGVNNSCNSEVSDPMQLYFGDFKGEGELDLSISKKMDKNAILLDDEFEYQIHIFNNSDQDAKGIKVHEVLSNSLQYQQVLMGYLGVVNYNREKHEIVWEFDELQAGQTEELRVRVKAVEVGWAEMKGEVKSDTTEFDLSNNTALLRKEIHIFKIPNIFTPNGDGLNDVFEVKGLIAFNENELILFTRQGSILYQTNNYQNDWTGEGLAEGTYYYVLRVKMESDWKVFKGHLTLVRNPR